MTRIATALLILALAACARSEEASLVPPDGKEGYNQVGKVGSPQDDDREPAIGQWRSSLQENVQVLEFGPIGTEPLFSLLCTGNRTVLLQRHGGAPAGALPPMRVSRGEVNEEFQVTAGGGTIPMLRAEISLTGPLAEALAGQGEPLMIRVGDGAPLVLPASPLVGDYLRSCATARSLPTAQGGNSAASAPAPGNAVQGNAAAPPANAAQPK